MLCSGINARAGGADPGPVLVDVKCYKLGSGDYCGTFTQEGTIQEDGDLSLLNRNALLKKCTNN